jgi:hypothetical protein
MRRPGDESGYSVPDERPTREVRHGYPGRVGEDPAGSDFEDRPAGRGTDRAAGRRADPATDRPPGRRADRAAGRRAHEAGPRGHKAPGQHKRTRTIVIAVLLVITTVVAGGAAWRTDLRARLGRYLADPTTTPTPAAQAATLPAASAGPSVTAPVPPSAAPLAVTQKGTGTYAYAGTQGAVLGTGGTLKRFRVAVENGLGQDPNAFAPAIDRVLADPRGWTSDTQFRFQRVPQSATADFTITLASPDTSEMLCATGGLYTEKFTNCRLVGQVVINLARWLTAVANYGAPLDVYQAYAINHEVGHELGLGHEACPGPGRLAPVMQPQTYGLNGCLPNPWPYVDGKRYSGEPIP